MTSIRPLPRRSVLFGLLGCAPVFAGTTGSNTIRISNGEWAPFMGESLPHHGFVSRIVTEAFKLEGATVQYKFYPWARAYQVARSGESDASIGWYRNAEREVDFLFSDTVFVESQVLFFLKDKPLTWSVLTDLEGKSIGATLGYTYGEAFKQLEDSKVLNVQRIASDEQNLKKLLAGRIDAMVVSRAVGTRMVNALAPSEARRIAFDPRPLNSGPLHVIFPKSMPQSSEWLARFNRGLKKLKTTGAADRFAQEG